MGRQRFAHVGSDQEMPYLGTRRSAAARTARVFLTSPPVNASGIDRRRISDGYMKVVVLTCRAGDDSCLDTWDEGCAQEEESKHGRPTTRRSITDISMHTLRDRISRE